MKCWICKKKINEGRVCYFLKFNNRGEAIEEKVRTVGKCCIDKLIFDKLGYVIGVKKC